MSVEIEATQVAGLPALRAVGHPNRPLLLFLHGAFVTHEPWRPWLARLAERGWPGLAVALPGRLGVGPERARGLRFRDYLGALERVVDGLGAAPVIVGHSMGGLLAQKLAERGRCRALILLAPAPAAMLTAQPVALPGFLPILPGILAGRPVRPTAAGCTRVALNGMPAEERPRCHASLVHESGAAYREMMFGRITVDASKVTCPTYVVGGADDRIISTALLRFTAERYRAKLRILEGRAHWLIEEPGWEAIADEVGAWLEAEGLARAEPTVPADAGHSRSSSRSAP